jgi:hypothetical protein
MNPDPKALIDPLLRSGAILSAAMNFTEIDNAPEGTLNRVLWHAMKGSAAPYPEWAAGVDDDAEDKEEHETGKQERTTTPTPRRDNGGN